MRLLAENEVIQFRKYLLDSRVVYIPTNDTRALCFSIFSIIENGTEHVKNIVGKITC